MSFKYTQTERYLTDTEYKRKHWREFGLTIFRWSLFIMMCVFIYRIINNSNEFISLIALTVIGISSPFITTPILLKITKSLDSSFHQEDLYLYDFIIAITYILFCIGLLFCAIKLIQEPYQTISITIISVIYGGLISKYLGMFSKLAEFDKKEFIKNSQSEENTNE